jgi:hypothetical protein
VNQLDKPPEDAEWYFESDDEAQGPITKVAFRKLASKGIVTPESRVRRGEGGKWREAKRLKGLFSGVKSDSLGKANSADLSHLPSWQPDVGPIPSRTTSAFRLLIVPILTWTFGASFLVVNHDYRFFTLAIFLVLGAVTWHYLRVLPTLHDGSGRQGQRSLTRFSDEHLGQVLVVPAAAAAFHDEAVSAWMLFQ